MTRPLTRLVVDDRYSGHHGIARYAGEVLSRLPHIDGQLGGTGTPTSARDVVLSSRLRLDRSTLLYSPGFGAGPSRCRQLLTVHDLTHLRDDQPGSAARRLYYQRVVRPQVRKTGACITVSETSRQAIVEWLDDPSVEVLNLGNGCSPEFTESGPTHEHPRPYVLTVTNTRPHKNLALTLAALRHLPEFDLIVVSPDAEKILQWAFEYELVGRVTVVHGVSDERLARLYRGAEAVALSSLHEGFGLPALEALRCGTNVAFLQECASIKEICAGTQVDCPTRDAHDFAMCLQAAASHPSGVPQHVRAYDWETVAERVGEVIDHVRIGSRA